MSASIRFRFQKIGAITESCFQFQDAVAVTHDRDVGGGAGGSGGLPGGGGGAGVLFS